MKKIFFLILFLLPFLSAKAEDIQSASGTQLQNKIIPQDTNQSFQIFLPTIIATTSAQLELKELNENFPLPWQLKLVSPIYQFDLKNKEVWKTGLFFNAKIKYTNNHTQEKLDYLRQIFFFDKTNQAWRVLPSQDDFKTNFITAPVPFSFAQLAVFEYPNIPVSGQTSWYNHKKGNFGASPDFPTGSKLRVFNIANNKFVDIVINDFGPDRSRFPERVLDLDKQAFLKIADTKEGIINVKIKPLFIAKSNNRILDILISGAKNDLTITAKAGFAFNEDTGEVYFSKNSAQSLPIASLTKLVAIKIFLDTLPTLNKQVEYKVEDEEKNYLYEKNKNRVSRLKIDNGDKLTLADLLYSSLVGSYNNTIETLVRSSGLNRSEFITLMNTQVKNWGASSTSFEEPTGLSPKNKSSAEDYALITKEVYKNPIIQKVSTMDIYKFQSLTKKKDFIVRNTNRILFKNDYKITGSKTGFLDEAGNCLMTRIETPKKEQIIIVVLGEMGYGKIFNESEDLLKYSLSLNKDSIVKIAETKK